MFEPDSRVVLMDQLRPPAGYRLEAAVTTTFTLHLPTALVAPLAFASYDLRTREDPIAALEAVRACADRVDIFCQAGQITVPQQASDLMAFLEPMLHPVDRPRPGYLFHPKIWFLRYTAADLPDAYRLICSTRNLADSRAWDAVVILDGAPGKRLDSNRPLASFLRRLPKWAVTELAPERLARVTDLADRAERVQWSLPEHVSEARFHALGVPKLRTAPPDFSGYRHLVVSPFLDADGVRRVTGNNTRDVALVSRPEALDALGSDLLSGLRRPDGDAVFVLDPLANADITAAESDTEQRPSDRASEQGGDRTSTPQTSELFGLHAKITVAERNRGETHVFIGSANATSAAYGGNVEFVVELIGRAKDLGVATMMDPPDGPTAANLRTLLQAYAPSADQPLPGEDEALRELENLLRTLAAVAFRITVEQERDGDYQLHLTSESDLHIPSGHLVRLALLTQPGVSHTQTDPGPCEANLPAVLADITPFVTMRVTNPSGLTLSTVVHAPLHNDPPHRLDEVLARQVDTPEKFLRFLSLLLGLTDPSALWAETSGDAGAGSWGASFRGSTGVFELLVRALADRPDALHDLDRLVRRLRETETGRTVLPDGFDELWASVMDVLPMVEVSR
ncbi:hypothetical protein GA0111570_11511 [Raineyella antarctica]|uniref:PLD phosphodiesterase domain-containing protein n=1 Tax=Raineyella antarctica TaxID=1577474 RepID=A0A1G6I9R6_9ACTN|nr:phospholipase D family protein [Raineyella antarctica]SDC03289.1 hypothetical protein GA0111570_11511 [Raineyella antarctica]